MRSAGRWQAEVWLQPRQAFRLRASRDRADCHAGWFSTGLRSHGWQHLGQDDTEGVSGQDRKAIWQDKTHLGDGSRHSDRGSVEWREVFPTAACVASLIDRLVHHAEIIAIDGESYRLKEATERSEKRGRQRRGAKP